MRSNHFICVSLLAAFFYVHVSGGTADAAILVAPNDWTTDDVVTLVYNVFDGSFVVDNPAGDDAAADAISTFELTSSVDFFTGPAPFEKGLFDVWNPDKAFILQPDGFSDASWPAGSVATGISNAHEILTLSGSFLAGGPLEPVDLAVVAPEPNGLVLLGISVLGLAGFRRRI